MINIKKIRPLYTGLITTARVYAVDEKMSSGLIDPSKSAGSLKEIQEVVAVGDMVRGVKAGDLVEINPEAYAVKKYDPNSVKDATTMQQVLRYNIPMVTMDGKNYLYLQERDIKYVIEEYEEEADDSGLIHPDNSLIL